MSGNGQKTITALDIINIEYFIHYK